MTETVLLVGAIVCAILYWGGILVLLLKNWHRRGTGIIVVGAILIWPTLLFMSFMQLLFVIPLYTVFYLNGLTLPEDLSENSASAAIFLTILFLGAVYAIAEIHG